MKYSAIARSTATTKATTCLFSFFISLSILLCCTDQPAAGWSSFIPLVLGAFVVAALLIVAVRTTIVIWITVLVVLACAGKRRRVLVAEGRKIAEDVAMHLFGVVFKERGLLAVACATLVSSMAMACLNY